jgi:hypothetical protein
MIGLGLNLLFRILATKMKIGINMLYILQVVQFYNVLPAGIFPWQEREQGAVLPVMAWPNIMFSPPFIHIKQAAYLTC